MWLIWAGFDLGPPEPKKRRSAGWSFAMPIRFARGTSPLIAYVVRPFSVTPRSSPPE